jgi:hypothetical protein
VTGGKKRGRYGQETGRRAIGGERRAAGKGGGGGGGRRIRIRRRRTKFTD